MRTRKRSNPSTKSADMSQVALSLSLVLLSDQILISGIESEWTESSEIATASPFRLEIKTDDPRWQSFRD